MKSPSSTHSAPAAEIQTERELEFVVFCIEAIAIKLDKPSNLVYEALAEKSDFLTQYLVPGYEVLHTQGREYIVNDLLEVMREKGIRI